MLRDGKGPKTNGRIRVWFHVHLSLLPTTYPLIHIDFLTQPGIQVEEERVSDDLRFFSIHEMSASALQGKEG